MFYNNLKTHVLEPNSHNSKRSEFKLRKDNSLFNTNWRLVDVGVQLSQEDPSANIFNNVVGNFPIKNIYLYDGKVELTKMTDAKKLVAFLNRQRSNDACANLKVLDGTNLGFSASVERDIAVQVQEVLYPNTNNLPSNEEDLTPKAHLSLQKYLPLLQKLSFLHTGIFKDLRLVVEWDYKDVLTSDLSMVCTIPKLVMEEVLNQQLAQQQLQDFFKTPIEWNEMENERFIMPAVVPTANTQTQRLAVRSTGFLNKTLGRVLIQKRGNVDNVLSRSQYSQNLFNEVIQVRVNGMDFLPDNGLNTSGYRNGLLCDTWGAVCSSSTSGQLSLLDMLPEGALFSNTSAYVGFQVGKKINELQLNVNRDYKDTLSTDLYGQVEITMFGEVLKTIVPDKFVGYQVVYL